MMKNFEAGFADIADNWHTDHSKDQPQSPIHGAYVAVARHTLAEIHRTTDDARIHSLTPAQRGGIEHGVKTIMRYYSHAISSASDQHIPYDEAVAYLLQPRSTESLQKIATQPNAVARHLEGMLCIGQDSVPTLEVPESYIYKWHSNGLTHPGLDYYIDQHRAAYELKENTPIDPMAICRAQKVHQLAPIAMSLLHICIKDESLFAASYSKKV